MQKKTDKFCFTLDALTNAGATGWYARLDGRDSEFMLETNKTCRRIRPDIERPDVFAAGYGDKLCGFEFRFDKPLADGQEVIFREKNGKEIMRAAVVCPPYPAEAANKSMMRMVEPFVEMDIAKARASLMENTIFQRYRKLFSDVLAMRGGNDFKRQIMEILADMKTTMHLLCAAYLDQQRLGGPGLPGARLNFCPDIVSRFVIDMRGDITGNNWSAPDHEGRWTGKDGCATLLLPSPGNGNYNLVLKILDESGSGAADLLLLEANGKDVPLVRTGPAMPRQLQGRLSISANQGSYLFLRFHFSELAKRPPAVKIGELEFSRMP